MSHLFYRKLPLCVLGGLLVASLKVTNVQALDNNLHFNGALVSEPCNLDPNTSEITVDFKTVVEKYLYLNTRTMSIPFVVALTDCDISLGNKVSLTFKGTEDTALPGMLAVTGSAKGIAVGMETTEGNALAFNQPTPAYLLASGNNSFKFMAYIIGEPLAIQNQSIIPGDFSATATFELAYP